MMKRRIALLALLALAGCERDRAGPDTAVPSPDDWTRPPQVLTVERSAEGMAIKGQGEPGGRVVLRAATGEAYAVAADADGAFEVRLPRPVQPLFLSPEAEMGQTRIPSTGKLLVTGDGPIALLRPGAPARRLDAGPRLGAVDSDGASVLISGRAPGAAPVEVEANGQAVTARAAPDGAWSVTLPTFSGGTIRVGRERFEWPGPGPAIAGDSEVIARVGEGWRIDWPVQGGGTQSTWLPVVLTIR